ncbi:unnamed protein product, partial [Prunus brigantina]
RQLILIIASKIALYDITPGINPSNFGEINEVHVRLRLHQFENHRARIAADMRGQAIQQALLGVGISSELS